MSLEDVEQM